MKNPWVHLAESPPYVLLDDRKYIDAFNRGEAERNPNPTTGLDLSLLPEPFVGNRRAPLVVLNLNPGWSLRDPENYSTPERRDAVWANLRSDEPDVQIHYAFTEAFAGTPERIVGTPDSFGGTPERFRGTPDSFRRAEENGWKWPNPLKCHGLPR